MTHDNHERLRRWRLILGGGSCDGIGISLNKRDRRMDEAMAALYDQNGRWLNKRSQNNINNRTGGTEASAPYVSRWLGDIREYFPASVVQIMQQDAIERVGLNQLLAEPEIVEAIDPDVHLVAMLISLKHLIPWNTRETARLVVRKVVDQLLKRLENPMRQAVIGSLSRAIRNNRPRLKEINWDRTVRANLKHYQPEQETIIPETLIGYGRKRAALRDVIICIDQSGSMATSVVYASLFGAVMASLPALKTHLVVFDTSVVDLTPQLSDPVEVLFGTQLGGGTDINRALGYCQSLINRPSNTILILISDLLEGGSHARLLQRVEQIVNSGVKMVALLTLSDDGVPTYDQENAANFANLGVPAFGCTPDKFPELMAAILNRQDIGLWAAGEGIQLKHK